MRVCFFWSDKPREHVLGDAFLEGVRAHGDEAFGRPLTPEVEVASDADVVCMVGVKSRELFRAHWSQGIATVYIDKGYTRQAIAGPIKLWEYWRFALNEHHPTAFLSKAASPPDRLDALALDVKPWRSGGKHVVFAGSSAKYHEFYGLTDPTRYAEKCIRRMRGLTTRPIWYRPKPSWKQAEPIAGSIFSREGTIYEALEGSHALVTHGSNACFDALLEGIPTIALGPAVTQTISSRELDELETPRLASLKERRQVLADLAYCQYTCKEMAAGLAWKHLKPQLYGDRQC